MKFNIQKVTDYYSNKEEHKRLLEFPGIVEFFRSKEIIQRFLPETKSRILDLGGGTGPYSFWLSDLGHSVHLVDPVKKHVEIAKFNNSSAAAPIAYIGIGDALQSDFEDESFDAVLLLGPMYHIQERKERDRVLANVGKCLKPGGLLFASYIVRFASMLDGFFDDLVADPEFTKIMFEDVATGLHYPNTDRSRYFTEAYLHRPGALREEAESAGFESLDEIAITGFAWRLPDLGQRWNDTERRKTLLRAIRLTEKEPSLMGMSSHAMVVARRS